MLTYKVIPNDGVHYFVDADYVEASGDWLLFYIYAQAINRVIHTCSSQATECVLLFGEPNSK